MNNEPSFVGEFRYVRVYSRVLTHNEIARTYKYERINFWTWYRRLWFWVKETLYLLGRK